MKGINIQVNRIEIKEFRGFIYRVELVDVPAMEKLYMV